MSKKTSSKTPMTQEAASRIYSATAKSGGGKIPADSFAARAESAAAKASKVQ
jgi:hypothetical protein